MAEGGWKILPTVKGSPVIQGSQVLGVLQCRGFNIGVPLRGITYRCPPHLPSRWHDKSGSPKPSTIPAGHSWVPQTPIWGCNTSLPRPPTKYRWVPPAVAPGEGTKGPPTIWRTHPMGFHPLLLMETPCSPPPKKAGPHYFQGPHDVVGSKYAPQAGSQGRLLGAWGTPLSRQVGRQ